MRKISRSRFEEMWREECREFLRGRGRRWGSDLLDALDSGELVVEGMLYDAIAMNERRKSAKKGAAVSRTRRLRSC